MKPRADFWKDKQNLVTKKAHKEKNRENTQINKIRIERGKIRTDTTEVQSQENTMNSYMPGSWTT